MRFRVERDDFADAVVWTARTLPGRPTMPVLAGLRLDATGDGLTLAGFDYEVSAQASVAATIAEPGAALVPGRMLADITRSLPSAPVEIAVDGSRAVVTCGTSRFALPTMPVEDYPDLPVLPAVSGKIASDAFAAAVAQVVVAAGRDDTLPVLTGVRIEIEGETMTLVSTDRYRLALRQLRWRPEDPAASSMALVPARTLADVAKTLAGTGAEVSLSLGSGRTGEALAGFAGGARTATTRLLEGEFPKYRSLLPSETGSAADIATAALVEATRRVALVASRGSAIRLSFEADELLLEAGTGDDAQASERVPSSYDGEPLSIAFNPGYLLDGLGALDSDTARLSFTDPRRPALLTGKHGDGAAAPDDYRYLLMPVRLGG